MRSPDSPNNDQEVEVQTPMEVLLDPTGPPPSLMQIRDAVTQVNIENGWFDDSRTFGEDIALLHSEASEALEAYRDYGHARVVHFAEGELVALSHDAGYGSYKPEGVASELADVLIRLLDTCHRYDVDLEAEVKAKLRYNAGRGHKHGGKRL